MFDPGTAQARGCKRPKTKSDIERGKRLFRHLRQAVLKAGVFRGMSKEEILEEMRRTREEVWAETKNAVGTRQ